MKRIAIICASGIGDALLMQISAAALQKLGYETVTYSKHLLQLTSWFPGFAFAEIPIHSPIESVLSSFDAVLLQNDNTPLAIRVRAMNLSIFTFFGDYHISKHGPLRPLMDTAFDPAICMAQNIALATARLFPGSERALNNGLTPPASLTFQKNPKRVVIHPTSTRAEKNWSKASFLQLANNLRIDGWEPVFIAPPEEADVWGSPKLSTLSDLAAFLYESGLFVGNDSGPGHLASNLGLKTLIIGPSKEHLTFWRPGWRVGEIAYPPRWVNKFKITRKKWKHFVSVNKVFKIFNKLKYLL
jgi:heptosyltransferase-3